MDRASWTVSEFVNVIGGEILNSGVELIGENEKFSVSTDTRTITSKDFYLPLIGEKFDGHDFFQTAIDNNCAGVFVQKNLKSKLPQNLSVPVIFCDDTKEAYLKLARDYRLKNKSKILAITGSSGKTTTKEMVFAVLNEKFKTEKSKLNHNNEIGLCQTLLGIQKDTEITVVEMGMRGLGEIELLSKYSKPDVAIITNIGTSHIGRLGSVENIAKAKCEITKYLDKNGVFIGAESEMLSKTLDFEGKKIFYSLENVSNLEISKDGSSFRYKNFNYKINETGEYNVLNALAAIEAGLLFGMGEEEIQKGLLNFKNVQARNEIITLPSGAVIINDCYNANPDSVSVSIKSMVDVYTQKKKIIVLGDMLELGEFEEFYHRQIGQYVNEFAQNVNYFVGVGNLVKITSEEINQADKKWFQTTEEAGEFLKNIIDENSVVLLKASRGMAFEKILNIIGEN